MSSPRLCKAGRTLREQLDDAFPNRDRSSDGWIGNQQHRTRKSDHNPNAEGWVLAIDLDADLRSTVGMWELANQLRLCAKHDKRINYIIFNGKIASRKFLLRWRKYSGNNPHQRHCHVSFTKLGIEDGSRFDVPLLGGAE